MAKAPRKAKEEIDVLTALKFVQRAQKETGNISETHSRIINGYVIAFDGILSAGFPIQTPLPDICPNTYQFIHALERANEASALTFENNIITVKTSKFKAVVPCIPSTDMQFVIPDPCLYPLTDSFSAAAKKAAIFTKEGAQTIVGSSVYLRNGTVVGTNGQVLLEVWHGTPTPDGLIVPKDFIDAVSKVLIKIVGFGFSADTFTIWFENGAWFKSQLYRDPWPNFVDILAHTETAVPVEIPKDFWEGVKSVAPFSEDGRIYFDDGFICSHSNKSKGADYKVKGITAGLSFNHKFIMALSEIAATIDFASNDRMVPFFGENVRGVIVKSK